MITAISINCSDCSEPFGGKDAMITMTLNSPNSLKRFSDTFYIIFLVRELRKSVRTVRTVRGGKERRSIIVLI